MMKEEDLLSSRVLRLCELTSSIEAGNERCVQTDATHQAFVTRRSEQEPTKVKRGDNGTSLF